MKSNHYLFIAILAMILFSQLSIAQEIKLKTTLQTSSATSENFAMKIRAPKGSVYHIDYGDGTAVQDKYGSSYAETFYYSFADMATQSEHQVRVWGADFLEFTAISNKKVTELTVTDCPNLEKFSCANNLLKQLDLSSCGKLSSVTCNNNDIALLKLPASVTSVNFSRNRLSLAKFPDKRTGMIYTYGPMRPIHLPEDKINGLTVDLTEMLEFNGTKSTFKWYYFDNKGNNADPALLIDPSTYTEKEGVFTFNQKPEKAIYCVVSNSKLPNLNNINDCYGIMPLELKGENKKLEQVHVAFITDKFTTEGLTFDLQLSATQANSSCVIDWGDGSFEETVLGVDTVTLKHNFLDAEVDRRHTVQIQCGNLDLMVLPQIGGFINFAHTMQPCPVKKLVLDNNRVQELDFSTFVNCEEISANGCYMRKVTLPQGDKLKKLSLRGGTIREIDLSSFTRLEELTLSSNQLDSIDLSTLTHLKKIDVSHNKLKGIKMSNDLSQLNEMDCSFNAIPMYMLPEKGTMNTYRYAPQEAFEITSNLIDGCTIDLSMFDNLKGEKTTTQPTTYIWLHGDDESKFIIEGVHYSVMGGKFTFKFKEPTKVFCTMQTAAFPLLASTENSYRTKPIVVDAQEMTSVNASVVETPLSFKMVHKTIHLKASKQVQVTLFSIESKILWTKVMNSGEEDSLELQPGVYILHANGMEDVKFLLLSDKR